MENDKFQHLSDAEYRSDTFKVWLLNGKLSVANLLLSLTVKDYLKSADNCQSYQRNSSGVFFYSMCKCICTFIIDKMFTLINY